MYSAICDSPVTVTPSSKSARRLHVLVRDRQHAPGDGEHLAHARDGLVERIAHAVERGEKEIAEALAAQRRP